MAKPVENRPRAVPGTAEKGPLGRVLLDTVAEGFLNVLLFVFGFLGWGLRWSLATAFFIAVMAGSAYLVFSEAVKGGGYVTVPNVTGLPVTQAANVLAESGLELGAQSQVKSSQVPEYHVMLQRPEAQKTVRSGRKIHITISAGRQLQPPPNLIGQNLDEALSNLGTTRFLAGAIARVPSEAARDVILAQDPAVSRQVALGTSIHLLVSDGPATKALRMPDLLRVPIHEALNSMAVESIRVDTFAVSRRGEDYNVVLDQKPDAGTLLSEGQVVELEVRLLPTTKVPNVKQRVDVTYTVPYSSENPEIRVVLVDKSGRRFTKFPTQFDFEDGEPPRIPAGAPLKLERLDFSGEATVEFYVDGVLDATYFYDGSGPPVITREPPSPRDLMPSNQPVRRRPGTNQSDGLRRLRPPNAIQQ